MGGWIQKLKKWAGGREPFDPAVLGDPIAMEIPWSPAKSGGSNFQTHKLHRVSSTRWEFRASVGAILFYLVFLLLGLGVGLGFFISEWNSNGFSLSSELLIPAVIGIVFTGVGGGMLYWGTQPTVFDRKKGFFWKGRKAPDEVFDRSTLKSFTELDAIYALQLVSEYCSGNKSSYYSYELNLVLEDGERLNVVDHGSLKNLRLDAIALSGFLGVPLWDGC